MIRFEKKAPPRQASDPGPDPLSRFFNHGKRGIHGKGAPILVGPVSVCSVCSQPQPPVSVFTCRQTVEALLAHPHRLAADGYDSAADGYDSTINPGGQSMDRAWLVNQDC